MTEREQRARALQERIGLLRDYLRSGQELFEEFLRECEFDPALHPICDDLIDGPDSVDWAAIEEIADLHRPMQVEDDCVELLRMAGTCGGQFSGCVDPRRMLT